MLSGAIMAAGGGIGLILAAIVLGVTLKMRRRIDVEAGGETAMDHERSEALRTLQEQIDRGSRRI